MNLLLTLNKITVSRKLFQRLTHLWYGIRDPKSRKKTNIHFLEGHKYIQQNFACILLDSTNSSQTKIDICRYFEWMYVGMGTNRLKLVTIRLTSGTKRPLVRNDWISNYWYDVVISNEFWWILALKEQTVLHSIPRSTFSLELPILPASCCVCCFCFCFVFANEFQEFEVTTSSWAVYLSFQRLIRVVKAVNNNALVRRLHDKTTSHLD